MFRSNCARPFDNRHTGDSRVTRRTLERICAACTDIVHVGEQKHLHLTHTHSHTHALRKVRVERRSFTQFSNPVPFHYGLESRREVERHARVMLINEVFLSLCVFLCVPHTVPRTTNGHRISFCPFDVNVSRWVRVRSCVRLAPSGSGWVAGGFYCNHSSSKVMGACVIACTPMYIYPYISSNIIQKHVFWFR